MTGDPQGNLLPIESSSLALGVIPPQSCISGNYPLCSKHGSHVKVIVISQEALARSFQTCSCIIIRTRVAGVNSFSMIVQGPLSQIQRLQLLMDVLVALSPYVLMDDITEISLFKQE